MSRDRIANRIRSTCRGRAIAYAATPDQRPRRSIFTIRVAPRSGRSASTLDQIPRHGQDLVEWRRPARRPDVPSRRDPPIGAELRTAQHGPAHARGSVAMHARPRSSPAARRRAHTSTGSAPAGPDQDRAAATITTGMLTDETELTSSVADSCAVAAGRPRSRSRCRGSSRCRRRRRSAPRARGSATASDVVLVVVRPRDQRA